MPHIDVKCTVWNRYNLPEDTDMDKVKELLEAGKTVDEVIDEVTNGQFGDGNLEYETLYDTESKLTPEQNDLDATIEVYAQEADCIYSNGKTSS